MISALETELNKWILMILGVIVFSGVTAWIHWWAYFKWGKGKELSELLNNSDTS